MTRGAAGSPVSANQMCAARTSLRVCALLAVRVVKSLFAFFCALFLVLSVSTGPALHAETGSDCLPTSSASAEHYDGDSDQVPDKGEKGSAHHHGGCSGHQVGQTATSSVHPSVSIQASSGMPAATYFRAGLGPDSQLRPPIA